MIAFPLNRYQRITANETFTPASGIGWMMAVLVGGGAGGGGGAKGDAVSHIGAGAGGGGCGQQVRDFIAAASTDALIGVGGIGGIGGFSWSTDCIGFATDVNPTSGLSGGITNFGSLQALGGSFGWQACTGAFCGPPGAPASDPIPYTTPGGAGTVSASNPIQGLGIRGIPGLSGGVGGESGTDLDEPGASSAFFAGGAESIEHTSGSGGGGASTPFGQGGLGGESADPATEALAKSGADATVFGAGGGGGGGGYSDAVLAACSPHDNTWPGSTGSRGGLGGDGFQGVVYVFWGDWGAPTGGTVGCPPNPPGGGGGGNPPPPGSGGQGLCPTGTGGTGGRGLGSTSSVGTGGQGFCS